MDTNRTSLRLHDIMTDVVHKKGENHVQEHESIDYISRLFH